MSFRTSYTGRYNRMCRLTPECGRYAGMSRVLQNLANPDVDEFDQESAQWTLLPQIADRVQPLLEHPVAKLNHIRKYRANKESIHSSLSSDPVEAKGICFRVLNGSTISMDNAQNEFLVAIRQEGRFLRWLAASLDPTFHSQLIEEGVKSWPEATALSYLWSGPESWCTHAMASYSLNWTPNHLSLHCDALKIGRQDYDIPASMFSKQLENAVLAQTGYVIRVVKKDSVVSMAMFKEMASGPTHELCDEALLKEGNCIAAAVYFGNDQPQYIITELKKNIPANQSAAIQRSRTYRDCQQLCKCRFQPVSFSRVSAGRSYIVHIENGIGAKAARLCVDTVGTCILTFSQPLFICFYGEGTWWSARHGRRCPVMVGCPITSRGQLGVNWIIFLVACCLEPRYID